MVDFVNAAPMVNDQGTNDLSTRPSVLQPLAIPQHLPKIYIFAEKGKAGPVYVDMNSYSLTQLYGDETFDISKKYFNHSTVFLQKIAAQGNNCVVHRLVPDDANGPANVTLWLDVLPVAALPVYLKNPDGSYQLTAGGAKIQDDSRTTAGYKVAWTTSSDDSYIGDYTPGSLASEAGDQLDGYVTSTKYPIFEFVAASPGSSGNKLGITLTAKKQTDAASFPSTLFNDIKNYPYTFGLKKIINTDSGKIAEVANNYTSVTSDFILEKNRKDPSTGAVVDFLKTITDAYIKFLGDCNTNELGYIKAYDTNIALLSGLFFAAESLTNTDVNKDTLINGIAGNEYAINILSFTNSNGSPYRSIQVADVAGSVSLNKATTVMLKEGTDGTLNNGALPTAKDAFDILVSEDLANYNDPSHEYMDLVLHPESHLYDTGFHYQTKVDFAKFISRRRDTYVVMSTWGHDAVDLGLEAQHTRGQNLVTAFGLYPESAVFGTPVMRASVIAGSCLLLNSSYAKRLPVSIEVAIKSAKYMGASNGRWKNGFIFDSAPGSVLTDVYDIDVTWIPTSVRNLLWSDGITFTGNYSIRNKQFTAMKTVYSDDTSVLNSYFVATAICYLNKIEHAAWREFTGNVSLTEAQFITGVNNFVAAAVKDRFDGKFIVIPDCRITAFDSQRGYSWTLVVKIGANGMKTVATTSVEAYRMADLTA